MFRLIKRRGHLVALCGLVAIIVLAAPARAQHPGGSDTPAQLVQAYDSLADTLIAANKTEWNLVHSILAMTYAHAEGTLAEAKAKLASGQDAGAEIERLATLVTHLANEGDASVAAVRKRLLDAGIHHHHHHASDDEEEYDPGFVIVDRKAKKALLDAAGRIARLGGNADVKALDAAWGAVHETFVALHPEAAH